MAYYECVFIARQDISASQVETLVADFTTIITDNGGQVAKSEYWGLRSLAYRISKNRKGHYLMFHVDGPGPAIQELERQLRIDENVVRYLTMRLDRLPEGPSIIMKARAEREERRDQESTRREAERQAADASGGETDAAESEAGGESDKPEEAEPAPKAGAAGSEPEASVAPSGEAEGEEQ